MLRLNQSEGRLLVATITASATLAVAVVGLLPARAGNTGACQNNCGDMSLYACHTDAAIPQGRSDCCSGGTVKSCGVFKVLHWHLDTRVPPGTQRECNEPGPECFYSDYCYEVSPARNC